MAETGAQKTGQEGEQLAANYLRQQGYAITTRNWRCTYGEIDLVASKDDGLVFVEVRTRHAATTESALASITPQKRQRMVSSAYVYLSEHECPDETNWRIDVIAIALSRSQPPIIDHVENALDW